MRSCILAIALIVSLTTFIQACVVVPLPSKTLLTDERLDQLVIGTTTRDDVYATFGDQHWPDPSGSGLVYSKDRLTAFGVSAWGAGAFEAVENLYVEFDDQNILTHFELFEFVDGKACVDTGVCMIADVRGEIKKLRSIAFSRPPNEDLTAKQFSPPAGQCSVYLYGDASLKARYRVAGALHRVCIDERFTTELYSPDLYLNVNLPPGAYEFEVGNAFAWHYTNGLGFNRDAEDLRTVSHALRCDPDTVKFLHIQERSELKGLFVDKYVSSKISLDPVDERTGRAEVTKRTLASDALNVRPDPRADGSNKGGKCFGLP